MHLESEIATRDTIACDNPPFVARQLANALYITPPSASGKVLQGSAELLESSTTA